MNEDQKEEQKDYRNVLIEFGKWAKENIALSALVGFLGISISAYNIHYTTYVKPREDFLKSLESSLSNMKMRAYLISDLCLKLSNGVQTDQSQKALGDYLTQQMTYIFDVGNLSFDKIELSEKSLQNLGNFIQWNHDNYVKFFTENKCVDNITLPDQINGDIKDLAEKIRNEIGQSSYRFF